MSDLRKPLMLAALALIVIGLGIVGDKEGTTAFALAAFIYFLLG